MQHLDTTTRRVIFYERDPDPDERGEWDGTSAVLHKARQRYVGDHREQDTEKAIKCVPFAIGRGWFIEQCYEIKNTLWTRNDPNTRTNNFNLTCITSKYYLSNFIA